MNDVIPSVVVVAAFGMALLALSRSVGRRQQPLVVIAVFVHIMAAIAMVLIVRDYYGYGDMLGYWRGGQRLAQLLSADFFGTAPDVVALLFQRQNNLTVIGNGWSTGSMHALSGILCFVLRDSLFAICLFVSLSGCAARLWLFAAVRDVLPPSSATAAAVVCLLIPSVVFWTSGLLKEAIATPALAIATGAALRWSSGRASPPRMVGLMIPAMIVVGLTKPYVLFPLAASLVVGYVWRRSLAVSGRVRIAERPVLLMAGVVVIIVAVVALGALFPRYSIANFADASEDLRALGASHAGGSTIALSVGRGTVGLLGFAPVAMATALFRPLIVEVKNPLMFISAVEMSVFLGLFVRAAGMRPRGVVLAALRGSWLFAAAAVFVLIFAFAVGASTTNLGTLSRYRVPMLPFYGLGFVALEAVRARLVGRRSAVSMNRRRGWRHEASSTASQNVRIR